MEVSDSQSSITKQYIINVIDMKNANQDIWASSSTTNYYARSVTNPLRVVPSATDSTLVSTGTPFSYKFGTQNAVGKTVFAFLNLPNGITGDTATGTLSGAFTVPGIYTLGVESADQSGSTAEGFVTVAVTGNSGSGSGSVASQVSSLNKVTVSNSVPFVYDVNAVQAQQTEADKQLFDALAAVNAAKA